MDNGIGFLEIILIDESFKVKKINEGGELKQRKFNHARTEGGLLRDST